MYGNKISLFNATYRSTQNDLALFFIVVGTNLGYIIVTEFVTQSETASDISEALAILKQWNPKWQSNYFTSDYSEDGSRKWIYVMNPRALLTSTWTSIQNWDTSEKSTFQNRFKWKYARVRTDLILIELVPRIPTSYLKNQSQNKRTHLLSNAVCVW